MVILFVIRLYSSELVETLTEIKKTEYVYPFQIERLAFFVVNKHGVWRWGKQRLHTYRYIYTTRMTPALRWAPMRAILMFY